MRAGNLFFKLMRRPLFASALLLIFMGAAGAYTIVLRDGRHLEVPSTFTLTKTTFTYEIAPGINRTVALILIDVPATERANNEAPGRFFQHAAVDVAPPTVIPLRAAQRTLTNRDLESVQQRRLESEKAYERRRVELGLPSIEETRRRQAEDERATVELLRARSNAEENSEAYWRNRAAALRREILEVDAQINYTRSRLAAVRDFPFATHSLVTSVLPLVPLNSRSAVVAPAIANTGAFVAPRAGSENRRGRVLISPAPSQFGAPRLARPVAGFGFPFGSTSGFGLPVRPFDYVEDAYDRTRLSDRLDNLLMTRAGLEALWRELEDEARDAKAPQVWLEP